MTHPVRAVVWMLVGWLFALSVQALELNQATEAELDSLRGMGPALNRRVRTSREVKSFSDWSDFMQRVSGMGRAKAQSFSDQGLTINAQPYQP